MLVELVPLLALYGFSIILAYIFTPKDSGTDDEDDLARLD